MHPVDLKTEISKMGKVFKAFQEFETVVDGVVGLNEQKSLLTKEIDTLKHERDEVAKGLKKEKDRLEQESKKTIAVEENAKIVASEIIENAKSESIRLLAEAGAIKTATLLDVEALRVERKSLDAEVQSKKDELKDATDKFDKLKAKISTIVGG